MTRLIFIIPLCVVLTACTKRHTIIIDGSIQSQQQLDKLDSSEIFSFTEWPPGEAPSKYLKWNKTTIVFVKTKSTEKKLQLERYILLNRFLDSVDKGEDILMVLNGIMIPKDLQLKSRKLSADQLDNVMTMELQAAKELYGPPARPITLVINTYDPKFYIFH